MSKSLIRGAVSTDFPTLLSIDRASFEAGIAYDSWELSYFMQRKGAETLVAEMEGKIVGFILMETRARRATIITLDVLEESRREGVATLLLEASEEILCARDTLKYDLQVDVGNTGAIEFYKKHGFEATHLLPGYYSNGNDAYLMVKNLA